MGRLNVGRIVHSLQMAVHAGGVIASCFSENPPQGKVHIWQSSYERARATAGWLHTQIKDTVDRIHDNALLVEQDFGLFEVTA